MRPSLHRWNSDPRFSAGHKHPNARFGALCRAFGGFGPAAVLGAAMSIGCAGNADEARVLEVPASYAFDSRLEEEGSSVSYSGQTLRHVLIEDLKAYIGSLTDAIDKGALVPVAGEVRKELDFYYAFDSQTSGEVAITLSTEPGTQQSTYNDVARGKTLKGKLAGNDPVGQHKAWDKEFVGWDASEVTSPESLLLVWFDELDRMAVERAGGMIPMDPTGKPMSKVHVTPEGLDLQQLIQKFLGGAVAFSQGVDDYLDDSEPGKGLLSSNEGPDKVGKPYTTLEHAWDEAFGYFGAARDYGDYTDDEIAGKGGRAERKNGYFDTDQDGAIDLRSEINLGHSVNAAKRDRGSAKDAPTDFSGDTFKAFLRGRSIISSSDGDLSDSDLKALQAERDTVVSNWEKAIAATVVHYINDVLQDMTVFDTKDYDFYAHAKHWSELKGFALALQFNPRSPLGEKRLRELHQQVGDAPVLPGHKDPKA